MGDNKLTIGDPVGQWIFVPANWKKFVLYDLAEYINGDAFKPSDFSLTGLRVIKITELKFGISHNTTFYSGNIKKRYLIDKGDLLFAWSGNPETSLDAFIWREDKAILNQHIFKVLPREFIDKYYLYFLLKYLRPTFIRTARDKATSMGHVKVSDLKRLIAFIPSISEQRIIAKILSALDDKIELNRRMNVTLDSMARAVFNKWFVENEDIGDWTTKTIGDICEFSYGQGLRADGRNSGAIPVYGSNGQIGWHNEYLVKGPGIVVGRKGNPGIVTWVQKDFFPIDTTFYVVPKEKFISLYWLYYELLSQNLPSLGADSAVPGLNRNIAYLSDVRYPTQKTMREFDYFAEPLFEKINVNDEESRTLASLRDALLPKLMRGELRVNGLGG